MAYSVFLSLHRSAPQPLRHICPDRLPANKSGTILNVTGNIQAGMQFVERQGENPEAADTCVEKPCLSEVGGPECGSPTEDLQGEPCAEDAVPWAKRFYP